MNLAEEIRHEIEMCEFHRDDDPAVAVMKIFKKWLRDHEDCDSCNTSINREIRKA